jgi:hypothetical protein
MEPMWREADKPSLIAAGAISLTAPPPTVSTQVREAITKAAQSGGKVLFTPET